MHRTLPSCMDFNTYLHRLLNERDSTFITRDADRPPPHQDDNREACLPLHGASYVELTATDSS